MLEWKDDYSKHATCAVNYIVTYQKMDGKSSKLNFQPHELPAVIGDLAEDTLYNYTIHTDLGWGLVTSLASEPVSLRTPKSAQHWEMSPVIVSNSKHNITISWNGTYHIRQFGARVELSWIDGANAYVRQFDSNSTEHLINRHEPN
ncbi:hypothetical protein EG68_12509 [Paragonimus skrjabini miyazakii]|uniref:Fibronectin type-III domain-containing protein n=1 Tax=Paragonimus skrjabini miyazakii TaxID=59628 RepID=A0A8S9YF42_9TREM|nr:hypothetical protein EG68_12509 [Paragonimus skrjabini miyazakii]